MMRNTVETLINKGPLPASNSPFQSIEEWQLLLERIEPPLSDEEAVALVRLFPSEEESCFGLAWSLLHLVESSPSWPIQDFLAESHNPWHARLRGRIK